MTFSFLKGIHGNAFAGCRDRETFKSHVFEKHPYGSFYGSVDQGAFISCVFERHPYHCIMHAAVKILLKIMSLKGIEVYCFSARLKYLYAGSAVL